MCGRIFSTLSEGDLADTFKVISRLALPARYNIAPTQPVAVVHLNERRQRQLSLMRWGLVPAWAREIGSVPLFNARAETVHEKPAFRGAFRYRRGLVPVSGWYEWQKTGPKTKQAYALHRANFAPLALACIWEVWEGRGEGSWLESCAILTTSAEGAAAAVHARMPVMVDADHQAAWLDGPPPQFADLTRGTTDGLVLTPVGPAVGNVANDGPQLLDQVPV